MARKLVLMSGYPGSGKSTLASKLAARLGFPLVSKDAILIRIFDAQGLEVGQAETAGKAAWSVFWHMAATFPAAVLDTNIKPGNSIERTQLDKLVDAVMVEVRCVCPAEVAIQRYEDRAASGHPAQRFRRLSIGRLNEYEGPLDVGTLIEVETTGPIDVDTVVAQIERNFNR